MSLFGRLLLALLAFGGTSTALLTVTSQIVPGWRPAGIQRPLDPRPAAPADEPEVHKVRQTSAEITVEGSPDLAAWILQPADSNEAGAVTGLVLVHGAGHGGRDRQDGCHGLGIGTGLINYLDFDVRSTLATLDLPMYGIWGADDPIVPINVAVHRLTDAARSPVTIRILPGAGHQLRTGTGWEADLADWIVSPANLDADDITGVEPASAAGVGGLPASLWYLNPTLHTILSAGVAILVFVMTSQKHRGGISSASGKPSHTG